MRPTMTSMRDATDSGALRPGEQLSLLPDRPESPVRIDTSTRLETLAVRLADHMKRKPAEPLEPERIVVPDPLMGQWLRLEVASHLGVAAHLRIEQPAEFAWAAMREQVEGLAGESVYGPPHLRWRIFDHLTNWSGDDEIARYLEDGDARKRFELADRLAAAYDRCRVYRPDSIRAWQQGGPQDWHARLWAELAAGETAPRHWVDAIDRYRDALAGRTATAPRQRVSFFHVASMSPTYVEVLGLAAQVFDVDLYLLSPSRRFWTGSAGPENDDQANELLDAWGGSARDLREQLQAERHDVVVVDRPAAEDTPRGVSRLSAVQRDILGGGTRVEVAKDEPGEPDDSIQIHVCHSPTREVEVLHDRLLGLFDDHPDIQPADVLVLTPDLDTYAPLVEAVFRSAGRVGVSIGTRRLKEGAALTAFLDLLELPNSRYTANDVLAPLLAASVRACFGIDDTGLATIRGAVAESRIRWGIDRDHRTELDVPASVNHNWRRGLDRLLLGYAVEEGHVLVDKVTPSALDRWGFRAGAGDYELLGRFHRYCEFVQELSGWSVVEDDADGWTDRLQEDILGRFFSTEFRAGAEAVREVNTVSRLIDEFHEECRRAGNTGSIPFPVLRDALNDLAAKSARSAPRLADGIAVAGLVSGQIFPAKVICAIGMNDRAFPRRPPPEPFDFQADLFDREAPRPGDRDPRHEDRFAFLEALLAARSCFVLTYTGRDLQEDNPIPPSVVVSELTDYLNGRFRAAMPAPDQHDRWETKHPLQPFSRRYFESDAPALFSYSQPMLEAATALQTRGEEPSRFAGEVAADEQAAAPVELELEDLIRFAASPSQHFFRYRLGGMLDTRDEEVASDEPLDLNALEVWQLKSELAGVAGELDGERSIELAAARGLLPAENLGRVQHRQSAAQVAELEQALERFEEHRSASRHSVEVGFGNVRLTGAVEQFHQGSDELLFWRVGSLRPKDRIASWLRLLTLISERERTAAAHLFGCGRNVETVRLEGPAPDEARALLGDWVEVWRDSRRRPLPFFARTSWEWTAKEAWGTNVQNAWSRMSFSEGNDACHRLIFGEDPYCDEFENLARRLLGPLRKATA